MEDFPKDRPIVLAALICDKILNEADGSISAIRITDRYTFRVPQGLEGKPLMPHAINIQFLIVIRAGAVRGEHPFSVWIRTPKGEVQKNHPPFKITFTEEHEGKNVIGALNLLLSDKREGIYWLELIYDDCIILTRTPFEIAYEYVPGTAVSLPQESSQQ